MSFSATVFAWKNAAVPMLRLGDVACLPSVRSGLSPFGPEYYLDAAFRKGPRMLSAYYRYGEIGIGLYNGAGLETWTPDFNPELGGGGWATVHYQPLENLPPLELSLTAGCKSQGFLQGERLEKGFDVRAGISITPGAR